MNAQPIPIEIQAWQMRLQGVGIQCKEVAYLELAPWGTRSFSDLGVEKAWQPLLERLSEHQPVALVRYQSDLLIASKLANISGQSGVLGCLIAPPHNEKLIQWVQLSLGWLQLPMYVDAAIRGAQASRLLDLLAHVLAQEKARSAAQDWLNRTTAWLRTELPAHQTLALSLFYVDKSVPHWWVSSDTAWVEKGSAGLQDALEVAARAALQTQEQISPGQWALPLFHAGQVTAVVVVFHEQECLQAAQALVRASAALAEPCLRTWRLADRSLATHAWARIQALRAKLFAPGHLTWKFATGASVALLAVLLFWPVDHAVKANLVMEGRTRQVITVPFEGFLAHVWVRPGDRVVKGQVLAQLDQRDLLLEQAKERSAAEQAAGRLRQAMGERDAAASNQAAAELHQAQAQLNLVDAKLARSTVRAPASGLIVSGDWAQQLGAPLENGKELFDLAAEGGYRVALHVADADIGQVQPGQLGRLKLTGWPGQTFKLRVSRVTAMASVLDGSNGFRVEADWLSDTQTPLSPGMQGVGKIVVGQTSLLHIWTKPLVDWLRLKWWAWL